MTKVLHTNADSALTWLRLTAGVVMFAHGAQKMLGWFGGYGFDATMGFFGQMGISAPLAMIAIAAEFFGSLALIVGVLTRPAALSLIVQMAVAVSLVHLPHGFFMNWAGTQGGEGFEYHILFAAMMVPLLAKGAGAWSVDGVLAHWLSTRHQHVARLRDAHAH